MTSLINLKLAVETKLHIELEAWLSGDKKWNVSNQFDEIVLESALEMLEQGFMPLAEKWKAEGADLNAIGVMDWAFCLSEFQPTEIDSAWID